jgi:hypothetical protein
MTMFQIVPMDLKLATCPQPDLDDLGRVRWLTIGADQVGGSAASSYTHAGPMPHARCCAFLWSTRLQCTTQASLTWRGSG